MIVFSVLHEVGAIMLSIQDLAQHVRIIVVEVDRILVCTLDLHLFLYLVVTGNHELSTSVEGENTYMREKQSLYISNIIVSIRTVFPLPDRPKTMLRIGSFPTTSYL